MRTNGPTIDELRSWLAAGGEPIKRFWSTSGTQYRELGLKEKLPTMTEEEQLQLLASDGMLLKRPVLVGDGVLLIGFKEQEWENRLIGS